MNLKKTWIALALTLLLGGLPQSSWGQSARSADELLTGWQMPEAERMIAELSATYPDEPNVTYLRARLAFFQGDYKRAVELLDEATKAQSNPYWSQLREVVANTQSVTKPFKRVRSPKGYFDLFVDPEADQRLDDEAHDQRAGAGPGNGHEDTVDLHP